jgi:hypothetical protein
MIGYDVAGSLPDGIAVLPSQNEPWIALQVEEHHAAA